MSIVAVGNALRVEGLTSTEKLVLVVLADYSDEEGRSFPKQVTIAKSVGCTREHVNRVIKKLAEAGLLRVAEQRREDGGRRENITVLHPDLVRPGWPPRGPSGGGSGAGRGPAPNGAPSVMSDHTPCDHGRTPPVIPRSQQEPSYEPSYEKSTPLPPQGGDVPAEEFRLEPCEETGQDADDHPPSRGRTGTKKPAKSRTTSKRGKGPWEANPTQLRINALFRRRASTRWTDEELKFYRAAEIDEEDLQAVEAYYRAPKSAFDRDIRRTCILRLVRHWPGEVDRARAWQAGRVNGNGHGVPALPGRRLSNPNGF